MLVTVLFPYGTSAATLYLHLINGSNLIWNGTTVESIVNANRATYTINGAEIDLAGGGTGYYQFTLPAALVAADTYLFVIYLQAGVNPILGDTVLYRDGFYFDGSTAIFQSGDTFARVGAAGAGLTALGDARLANLNATVLSRATPAQILSNPANLIATDASGRVTLTPSQIAVKKNAALGHFPFVMRDSTNHMPCVGLTVTARRSINGGAFAAATNPVTEIGSGWYDINMSAADHNGDTIAWHMSAIGADNLDFTIVTQA